MKEKHYQALCNMYYAAPINQWYQPSMSVRHGEAEIEIEVKADYFHAGQAVHGSVYFKMLDDAAFFAASSMETEVFMLTTSFTTYLTRPVSSGKIRAVGKVVNYNRSQFICEAVAYNEKGKEIGRGNGIFVRSKNLLANAMGYSDAPTK